MLSPYFSFRTLLCLILVSAVAAFSQTEVKDWTPASMIKIKRVGGTSISPDGKWIAYTVSSPVMEGEKSEFLTHIWLVATDGSENKQFTFGDQSCTGPQFSPDGSMLSFLSSRGSGGKNQVWIMSLKGGEAEQLTRAKSAVSSYAWSPDSKRIAYLMSDPETEQEEKAKKEKRDWVIENQNHKYVHLYVIPMAKDADGDRSARRLTAGTFHVTSFHWSPDAKVIAFAHQATPLVDDWPTTDISTVPSDSGAVKPLVKWPGSDNSPHFSPDGQWISFSSDKGDTRWAQAYDLYIVSASGGEPKKLAETPDRNFSYIAWAVDGKSIYIAETDKTVNRVYALPVDGNRIRTVTTGAGSTFGVAFSLDGKTMSYIHQTPEIPPDVYCTDVKTFEPRKLTSIHANLPTAPVAKTEVIRWKSKDDKEIEGLLTYPANYKAGVRCPLILNIHGGPAGVFTQTFTGAGGIYPLQAFAHEGYAILRPNPRGSGGYGAEFRRANINDWGFGDFEDDQTGVDKVIQMGIAHPDSLVICGWSYGGYMTSFAITKSKRFKAASVGAGVTNLVSFTGTADIPSFLPSYFGGEFWNRTETYMKHSAMFNIKSVTTPTQVIHGLSDVRVPPSQGYELYNALKRLGCPTEMIVYPRTPHGVQEPKFIQDIGERMISWFNKHLKRGGAR